MLPLKPETRPQQMMAVAEPAQVVANVALFGDITILSVREQVGAGNPIGAS